MRNEVDHGRIHSSRQPIQFFRDLGHPVIVASVDELGGDSQSIVLRVPSHEVLVQLVEERRLRRDERTAERSAAQREMLASEPAAFQLVYRINQIASWPAR